jgi:hypothetical protein
MGFRMILSLQRREQPETAFPAQTQIGLVGSGRNVAYWSLCQIFARKSKPSAAKNNNMLVPS